MPLQSFCLGIEAFNKMSVSFPQSTLSSPQYFPSGTHCTGSLRSASAIASQSDSKEIVPPFSRWKTSIPNILCSTPHTTFAFFHFFSILAPVVSRVSSVGPPAPMSPHRQLGASFFHCHTEHNFHLLLTIQYWEILIPKILIFQ